MRGWVRIVFLAQLFVSTPGVAQSQPVAPHSPDSLPVASLIDPVRDVLEAPSQPFSVLREWNAQILDVLCLERLAGTDRYFAEVRVRIDPVEVRVPIVLRRSASGTPWLVDWQPKRSYLRALVSMTQSGQLVETPNAPRWVDAQRIAAFPVIVTQKRVLTPLGWFDWGALKDNDVQSYAHGLEQIRPLSRFAHRWVEEVLGGDPAPASMDLILARNVSWQTVNDVIFTLAFRGLFRIFAVTASSGEIRTLPLSAPVGSFVLSDTPPVTLGLNWRDDGVAVARMGHPALAPENACPDSPKAWRCSADLATLVADIGRRFRTVDPSRHDARFVFSTVGETSVGDAFGFLDRLLPELRLAKHKVVVIFARSRPKGEVP